MTSSNERERMRKLLGVPPPAVLQARARVLAEVRRFFAHHDYTEIEPPTLVPNPGLEIHIQPLETTVSKSITGGGVRHPVYLHTSPEFAMKKLLAAGYDRIYSLGRVYRDGEVSERHNPEFTMLEWYEVGQSFDAMMQQTEALCTALGLSGPYRRFSIATDLGIDWTQIPEGDAEAFARQARQLGVRVPDGEPFDDVFDRLMLERFTLQGGVFVCDYPVELAVLSRRNGRFAERFELFYDGLELCNAFGELTDPIEQRLRFEAERAGRVERGLPAFALDEDFLSSLQTMPAACGNALGVDRVVMLLLGAKNIDEVLAFSAQRLLK